MCTFCVLLRVCVRVNASSLCAHTCMFRLLQGFKYRNTLSPTLPLSPREIDFLIAFREYQQSHYSVITALLFAQQSASPAQYPDFAA